MSKNKSKNKNRKNKQRSDGALYPKELLLLPMDSTTYNFRIVLHSYLFFYMCIHTYSLADRFAV